MTKLDKLKNLHVHIDNFRVFPRIYLGGYGILIYTIGTWFMGIPDPTGAQAAFVATMVGASAHVFGLYTKSGKPANGE